MALNSEQLAFEPSAVEPSISGISNKLEIYPNPGREEINIGGHFDQLSIYSISGKLVKQSANYCQKADISNLAQGIYLIQIHLNGSLVGLTKIVKE